PSLKRLATTTMRRPSPRGSPENSATSISDGEEVTELGSLGLKIGSVLIGGGRLDAHTILEHQTVAVEAHELARVVGEYANGTHAEIEQNLRADAVVAKVGFEAELLV